MANRINRTPVYQDITQRDLNLVRYSMLCINMAKDKRNNLMLKEKNKSHRCKSHSQSVIISRLNDEDDDQLDQFSTHKTFLDSLEGIDSIVAWYHWKVDDYSR